MQYQQVSSFINNNNNNNNNNNYNDNNYKKKQKSKSNLLMINKYINTCVKNIILGTIKNMNLIRGPYLLLKIIIIIIKNKFKMF